MRLRYGHFSVSGVYVVAVILGTATFSMAFPDRYASLPMLGGLAFLFAAMRLTCKDCGARGGLLFSARHECEAIRRRRESGEGLPSVRRSRWEHVVVGVILAVVLALAALMVAFAIWPPKQGR